MKLTFSNVTKQYKDKKAVDSISVTLTSGIYGLLGANGAGKTTLMRMTCGILNPTSGDILLDGKNTVSMGESYREILGYLPQNFGYYPGFTAVDYLMYVAALKGLSAEAAKVRSNELLELVSLESVSKKKIKTFSGGMKRRLGIAQALLNDPGILVLDEPTAGLDPKERVHFRNLISQISRDKIVILSTHIVSDVEYIADTILMMKDGRIINKGQPSEIILAVNGCVWESKVETGQAETLRAQYTISNLRHGQDQDILRIVSKNKPDKNAIQVQPTLEDLYLFYFSEESQNRQRR